MHETVRKAHAFNIHLYLEMAQVVCMLAIRCNSQKTSVLYTSCTFILSKQHAGGIQYQNQSLHLLGQQQRHMHDLSKPHSPPFLIAFVPQCQSSRAENQGSGCLCDEKLPIGSWTDKYVTPLYRICTEKQV